MKHFLLITFLVLLLFHSFGQTSVSSGDWDNPATWGGSVPATSASVTIANGHIVEIDDNPQCAQLTVNSGGTLRVKSGAGARTLTITSTSTSNGNIIVNGSLDLASGADSVNVAWNSNHTNAKTLGGTGSIEFNSLLINHTNSFSRVNISADPSTFNVTILGVTLIGAISAQGNVNCVSALKLFRGILMLGTQNNATQAHTVKNFRIGNSGSAYSSNLSCFSNPITGYTQANTGVTLNNAVQNNVTLKVTEDFIVESTVSTSDNANGVGISLCGNDARGALGTIPSANKTRLIVERDLRLDRNTTLVGNGVFNDEGITMPMDSLVVDIGRHFSYTKIPRLTVCFIYTQRLGFAGYAAGKGNGNISYPVFKFRGGTASDPAIISLDPKMWMTVNSNVADGTCNWRIEEGAYVQIAATSGIPIRESRRLQVNGTLDILEGGQLIFNKVGSGTGEPILSFGSNGKIIVRDVDGLGATGTLYDASPRGVFTAQNSGSWNTATGLTGLTTGGIIEYVGSASQVITPRSYYRLQLNKPGQTINLSASSTYTIPNNGELRLLAGTLRLSPSSNTTLTVSATNSGLIMAPGTVLETNGVSLANFVRFGNFTASSTKANTIGAVGLSGTVRYNSTLAATEIVAIGSYDTLVVDRGVNPITLGSDTINVKTLLRLESGSLGVASGTLRLERALTSGTGNILGATTGSMIIADAGGQPSFTMPLLSTPSLNNFTVLRASGITNSNPLTVNNLYLRTGGLTLGSSANLTIATAGAIFKGAGTIDVAPTFAGTVSLNYMAGMAHTPGLEFPASGIVNLNLIDAGTSLSLSGYSRQLSGTINVASGTVLNLNGSTLDFTSTGTLTLTNNGTINGGTSANLTFSGNTTTAVTLPRIVGGIQNLTLARPVTLGTSASLRIGGLVTYSVNRALTIGANHLTIAGTFSGTGSITGAATSVLSLEGTGALGGTITYPTTLAALHHKRPITWLTNTLTADTIEVATGSTLDMTGRSMVCNAVLDISGSVVHSATTILRIADLGNSQPQFVVPTTKLTPYIGTFIIDRVNGASIGAAMTVTNFGLRRGTVTNGSNLTIANTGTVTRFLGSFSQTPTFAGTANLAYGYGVGLGARITMGAGNEVPPTITNLTINSDTGAVLIGANRSITGNLVFTTGRVRLEQFDLTVPGAAANISGVTATRYIEADGTGGLIRTISGAATLTTTRIFPIGSAQPSGSYSPIGIGNTAALTVKARVRDFICSGNATTCSISVPNTVRKTWEIDIISGTPNATLDLGWRTVAQTGTFTPGSNAAIYRYNSSTGRWQQTNATIITAIANTDASFRVTGKTQFSPHGVANQNGVLPVELNYFNGSLSGHTATLNWATIFEKDNKGWFVERSKDGKSFESVGFVASNGDATNIQTYEYQDVNVTGFTYYRLRQVDLDGTTSFSDVISVGKGMNDLRSITLAPNPTKDHTQLLLNGNIDLAQEVRASIVSPSGKTVLQLVDNIQAISNWIKSETTKLPAGIYIIKLSDSQQTQTLKLVKD